MMNYGLAIIASRVGGLTEIIDENNTGKLIDLYPGRSIHYSNYGMVINVNDLIVKTLELLYNENLRVNLSLNAEREVKKKFSNEEFIEKFKKLFYL